MKTKVTLYAYLDQSVPIHVPRDGQYYKDSISDMELEIDFELDIDPGEQMDVQGITLKPSISSMEGPFDDLLYQLGMEALQDKTESEYEAHIDSQIDKIRGK